jgi:hypothetical protein
VSGDRVYAFFSDDTFRTTPFYCDGRWSLDGENLAMEPLRWDGKTTWPWPPFVLVHQDDGSFKSTSGEEFHEVVTRSRCSSDLHEGP